MRSAAEGEHRTGEECLDGIARRRAILPERWAIGTRCHGAWSVAASKPGCVPSSSLSRAKVLTSPRRASGQPSGPSRADGRPGRPGGQAQRAAPPGAEASGMEARRGETAQRARCAAREPGPAGRRPCLRSGRRPRLSVSRYRQPSANATAPCASGVSWRSRNCPCPVQCPCNGGRTSSPPPTSNRNP